METTYLTKVMAELILQQVRHKRGRLTWVSRESHINRSEFCVERLVTMRFYRAMRIFYILVTTQNRSEFMQMMNTFWEIVEDTNTEYNKLLLGRKQ